MKNSKLEREKKKQNLHEKTQAVERVREKKNQSLNANNTSIKSK